MCKVHDFHTCLITKGPHDYRDFERIGETKCAIESNCDIKSMKLSEEKLNHVGLKFHKYKVHQIQEAWSQLMSGILENYTKEVITKRA